MSDYREEVKMKCLMCIGARCSWVVSKTSVTVFESIIDAKYIFSRQLHLKLQSVK